MIRYDYQSPIGVLALVADDAALRGLSFEGGKHGGPPADAQQGTNAIIDATRRQLDAYFAGRSKAFDLPLAPDGTDFQKRVWRVLATIPFGETRSYGEIAATIGAAGVAGSWRGERTQSDPRHRPVPPRHWRRRKPYRFWRRHGAQALPVGA